MDGQIPFEYGYVWTLKSLNPEGKSCGLKHTRIRAHMSDTCGRGQRLSLGSNHRANLYANVGTVTLLEGVTDLNGT